MTCKAKTPQQEKYAAYLLSDAWLAFRAQYYETHARRCWVCRATRGVELHHWTYERLGHEQDGDVVPLCRSCHQKVHESVSAGTKLADAHAALREQRHPKPAKAKQPAVPPQQEQPPTKRRLRKKRQKAKLREAQRIRDAQRDAEMSKAARIQHRGYKIGVGAMVVTTSGEHGIVEHVGSGTIRLHIYGEYGYRKANVRNDEIATVNGKRTPWAGTQQ